MKKGIAIAGNLIVDIIKNIDAYPEEGRLCNICGITRAVGGCAANTAADIAVMEPGLKVMSVGFVGNDENGDFILRELEAKGVDTSLVTRTEHPTSFTDVMSVEGGQRTFFHARGANAYFDSLPEKAYDCDILHMGYALLLDKMDAPDGEHGTRMARVLAHARSRGIKTSLDVVSEVGDRFRRIVSPSLKHCDYLIVNETEASYITGIPARGADGKILTENIGRMLESLLLSGVRELAAVHAPEGGWALKDTGEYGFAPSLKLPEGYIKGTVGAGDAFCAGMLYALYSGYSLEKALRFAAAAAACSLSEADAISGMKSAADIWKLHETLK